MRRKYIRPYTEGHYRSNIKDNGDASISIRETKYMNILAESYNNLDYIQMSSNL